MPTDISKLVAESVARFNAMSPEDQRKMREAQRESWVRSIVDWPKPKFKWVDRCKVYESFHAYPVATHKR